MSYPACTILCQRFIVNNVVKNHILPAVRSGAGQSYPSGSALLCPQRVAFFERGFLFSVWMEGARELEEAIHLLQRNYLFLKDTKIVMLLIKIENLSKGFIFCTESLSKGNCSFIGSKNKNQSGSRGQVSTYSSSFLNPRTPRANYKVSNL